MKAAGLRSLDLAKRFSPQKPFKMQRNLDKFKETGRLPPSYLDYFSRELGFTLDEVHELERRHELRFHRQRNLFIAYFDLIEAQTDLIRDTPAWCNIVFQGMGLGDLCVSRERPLTLGELLGLYRKGLLIHDDACCGRVHLLFGVGSYLSGMNYYEGFCRTCRRVVCGSLGSFSQFFIPVRNAMGDKPYKPSQETVKTLILALLEKSGSRGPLFKF
jgi:hypothetical protein